MNRFPAAALLLLGLFLSPLRVWAGDFKAAYESFLKRDYAATAAQLPAAKPAGHLLEDYYLWALGRSQLETGATAEGRKNLELLLKTESDSLFAPAARVQIGRALQAEGQAAAAKQALSGLLPNLEGDLKGEALFYLALAEGAAGEKEPALEHLKQAYWEYPTAPTTEQIPIQWQKLAGSAFPTGSAAERMAQADRWFAAQSYSKALAAYLALSDDPDPARRELAQLRRGESLYALKRYSEAIPFLQPGPTIPADLARSALLHQGMSRLRNHDEGGAVSTFENLQRQFPGSPEGEEALYRAGMISYQAGRIAEAAAFFQKLADAYPHGNFRDKALWAAAWEAYRRSDWPASLKWLTALEQGAADAPTRGKALYWQGRIAERQSNGEAAKKLWERAAQASPLSYYGFMSLKKLQGSTSLPDTPSVPAEWKAHPAPPSATGGDAAAAVRHLHKAEALAQAGLGRLSAPELERSVKIAEGSPHALTQVLESSHKTSAYFIPVLISQKYWERFKSLFATPEAAEAYRNHLQYPYAYRREVEAAASRFSVPPALVVALMRQESGFMPWISSSANAQGLMQLLTATANNRAKALGLNPGDLFDPDYNITVGAAELKAMLDRFSNNWAQAFAAYNAGPGRARQWAEQFTGLAPDDWIEEIPFAETNLYVKLVLRNYWVYQTLY